MSDENKKRSNTSMNGPNDDQAENNAFSNAGASASSRLKHRRGNDYGETELTATNVRSHTQDSSSQLNFNQPGAYQSLHLAQRLMASQLHQVHQDQSSSRNHTIGGVGFNNQPIDSFASRKADQPSDVSRFIEEARPSTITSPGSLLSRTQNPTIPKRDDSSAIQNIINNLYLSLSSQQQINPQGVNALAPQLQNQQNQWLTDINATQTRRASYSSSQDRYPISFQEQIISMLNNQSAPGLLSQSQMNHSSVPVIGRNEHTGLASACSGTSVNDGSSSSDLHSMLAALLQGGGSFSTHEIVGGARLQNNLLDDRQSRLDTSRNFRPDSSHFDLSQILRQLLTPGAVASNNLAETSSNRFRDCSGVIDHLALLGNSGSSQNADPLHFLSQLLSQGLGQQHPSIAGNTQAQSINPTASYGQSNAQEPLLPQEMADNLDTPGLTGRSSITLALSCDKDMLSPYQCLVRQQIELFEAKQEDINSNAQGRNRPIVLGQVGIRCRHCVFLAPHLRSRGSTYYPSTATGLYQAAQNLASGHLCNHCRNIPSSIRDELLQLSERKSFAGGGKKYWAEGVRSIGVFEDENGLRFSKDR